MAWLEDAVIDGLQMLLVLRLRGSPATDDKTVNAVADVWLIAFESQPIAWCEEEDAWRIRQAFRLCVGDLVEWPAPKTVLTYIPKRKEKLALPAPKKERSPMPPDIKANLAALLGKICITSK